MTYQFIKVMGCEDEEMLHKDLVPSHRLLSAEPGKGKGRRRIFRTTQRGNTVVFQCWPCVVCSGYKDLVTTGALQYIPLQHCRAPADTTQQNTQHAASYKKWIQNTNLIIRLKVLKMAHSPVCSSISSASDWCLVVPAAVCLTNILLFLLQLPREKFYKSGVSWVARSRGDPQLGFP